MSYLRYLCLSAHNGVQNILCCLLFVFVLCTPSCQFLWIINFSLPLRYSSTFIYTLSNSCLLYGNDLMVYAQWYS